MAEPYTLGAYSGPRASSAERNRGAAGRFPRRPGRHRPDALRLAAHGRLPLRFSRDGRGGPGESFSADEGWTKPARCRRRGCRRPGLRPRPAHGTRSRDLPACHGGRHRRLGFQQRPDSRACSRPETEASYGAPVPELLMTALVEAWDPDWCTWISSRLRRAQQVRPGKAQVGWLTWIHADLSDLGGPAGARPLAAGSLLRLGDSPGAVATDDVSVTAALRGAGRNH